MGHPCLGLVVKLQSHDPPGHWPGCGGVGRWPSFCCCWRDPEGQRSWGDGGPGPGVKEGPCSWEHTATPLTGSQVGVVCKHLSFTHTCVGTRHRRSLQHCSHVHTHARTCSHHTPYSTHVSRHQAHADTQTHTHYTHVRLLSTPCSLQAPPYLTHILTSPQAPSQSTAPENQSR